MPGIGTAIGAGVGGIAGLLGEAFGSSGPSEEDLERQRQFLLRKQALELEGDKFQDGVRYNELMGNMFKSGRGSRSTFRNDAQLQTAGKRRDMSARGQRLERDMFEEDARRQLEGEDPGAREWIGALMGGAGAVAGAVRGLDKDPMAARKAQLYNGEDSAVGNPSGGWSGALQGIGNGAVSGAYRYNTGTANEADFINSGGLSSDQDRNPLSGAGLSTALEENDERTRAALFGSKRRMSPYDF